MTLSRRSCKLSNCALSLRERLLHFQPSDVYETGSRPEEMLFSWIGLAGYMVHSGGCSVRLRTHDGRALGVDRPSSQVVEKHDDARFDKYNPSRRLLMSS